MLELRYPDWLEEFTAILNDVYDITPAEFCKVAQLPKYYKLGYSPLETFETLESEYGYV